MAALTPGGFHQVQYGTTTIPFEVVYAQRKTLAISVYPDRAVMITAPGSTDLSVIESYVQRRAAWIVRQWHQFEAIERPTSPRRAYVSGEAYRFLGRQYRLKVVGSGIQRVLRTRGYLIVETRTPEDSATVGKLLERWFSAQAERVIRERLEVCFARIAHWNLEMPALVVRPMKLRWGSLSPRGSLTINRILVQAPTELIDYVILHELCHLREMNHKPSFYALLDQVLPAWRELRHELNRYDFI